MKTFAASAGLFALLFFASSAFAQYGAGQPGGGFGPGGPGAGRPTPGDAPKEDGPAETAPEEEEVRASDLEPLGGYAGQGRRRTQIIELDGYLRVRTDWLHKLNLGQGYIFGQGGEANPERTPPFPQPLECGVREGDCDTRGLGAGNMRLRLEPTINITDQVRVLSQIDVFDNMIMGSTPDSVIVTRRQQDAAVAQAMNQSADDLRTNKAQLSALYTTQNPPEVGVNGLRSSIRAKRAWGEVDSEFGSLRFGRMPWHFGRGLAFNNGDCQDCDGGTNVDRVMALSQVYGHQVALSWDFGAKGHHVGMIDIGQRDPEGIPLDLSGGDDVQQFTAGLSRIESERHRDERVSRGDVVLNYAAQLVYRNQNHEVFSLPKSAPGMDASAAPSREELARNLTQNVDALAVIPSLWMRLQWKVLTVELETTGVFGRIRNAGPLTAAPPTGGEDRLTLRQLGWVMASELRLFSKALFVGFETGGATGDQANNPNTYLNYRWKSVQQPNGDTVLGDFKFSPDYRVDEILFYRIIGTVTNAIYLKPKMTYWLHLVDTRQLGLSAAVIYSFAPVPVSTPGNALSYGLEMNLGLTYRNQADGFYAGATWGVLWPMGALDRPGRISSGSGGPSIEESSSAQILRTFLGIRF